MSPLNLSKVGYNSPSKRAAAICLNEDEHEDSFSFKLTQVAQISKAEAKQTKLQEVSILQHFNDFDQFIL